MRRILTFPCEGAQLAATLDEAAGTVGLLIVSGGNEIRIGAHRGMAKLAADVAGAGFLVFRFDRRGIGDSEGENGGFTNSAVDIDAAIAAFRRQCPQVKHIIAFGNCDAASALTLHRPVGVAAYVLANIWVVEPEGDLPPPAAIRARYLERLRDPKAWLGIFTGAVNLKKLINGLRRISKPQMPSTLAQAVADGLAAIDAPVTILLAKRDATAIAFADAWQNTPFAAARGRSNITLKSIDSASHGFAGSTDYQALRETIITALQSA
jgi:exosortase A-associated hydrolase 1